MSRPTKFWFSGLIVSLAVAVLIGGTSFVLMTIGTHRYLSAVAGKDLSNAQLVRTLTESTLAPVQLTTAGMLIGALGALCFLVFLVGALVQFRRGPATKLRNPTSPNGNATR